MIYNTLNFTAWKISNSEMSAGFKLIDFYELSQTQNLLINDFEFSSESIIEDSIVFDLKGSGAINLDGLSILNCKFGTTTTTNYKVLFDIGGPSSNTVEMRNWDI